MRVLLCIASILLLFSCSNDSSTTIATTNNICIDSSFAQQYGADDYGMKQYVIAFLKAGPNRDLPKEEAQKLQLAHMQNINRLAEEGKLIVAGPFLDGGELRGIYIFNVESAEEAEKLTNTDPAIQAGSLVMELKPWYGSAALISVNDIHNIIATKNITD